MPSVFVQVSITRPETGSQAESLSGDRRKIHSCPTAIFVSLFENLKLQELLIQRDGIITVD